MLANAGAVMKGVKKVETEVDGLPWVQEPFPYQAKCIQWIGEEYDKLDGAARQAVSSIIAGTGCEKAAVSRSVIIARAYPSGR